LSFQAQISMPSEHEDLSLFKQTRLLLGNQLMPVISIFFERRL